MHIALQTLNRQILDDPTGLIARCDARYDACIREAAENVIANRDRSPIIFLTGPSSAGKTTSASRVKRQLEQAGFGCQMVSMDDYYRNSDDPAYPRTEDGELDLESPLALDTELLNAHFSLLEAGKSVTVPHFSFATRRRESAGQRELQLGAGEFVIFEGLHALNPMFTEKHPGAYRIYVNPQSDVVDGKQVVFHHTWTRLMRRCIRDMFHRNASVELTLSMWENIRRGERLYIAPYTASANYTINTLHDYEISVLAHYMKDHIRDLPENCPQWDTVQAISAALDYFAPLDPALVPETSLLKEEFI